MFLSAIYISQSEVEWVPVFVTCLVLEPVIYLNDAGDKIEKNEIGWACGAYG